MGHEKTSLYNVIFYFLYLKKTYLVPPKKKKKKRRLISTSWKYIPQPLSVTGLSNIKKTTIREWDKINFYLNAKLPYSIEGGHVIKIETTCHSS